MQRNLLVHSPANEKTRYYRDYNLFWDDLTDELKKTHNVSENRFFENAHIGPMKVHLQKRTYEFLEMLECEYIIEDLDSGDFWILSASEQISNCIMLEQYNTHLKKVLYSQYVPEQIVAHARENSYKFFPWIFFPQNVVDLESYYEKRKNKTEFIDRLFFRGGVDYRPIVSHINQEILSSTEKINHDEYFDYLINHEICLSIGGVANGDLCYRDIECMALGVPLLRFEFSAVLNPGLIPNYHYISIPIQLDFPVTNGVLRDRLGLPHHAKLIEERYLEVTKNKNLINFISKNAKDYYEKYLSRYSRIKYTLELLQL
jgi:hypothetical protein